MNSYLVGFIYGWLTYKPPLKFVSGIKPGAFSVLLKPGLAEDMRKAYHQLQEDYAGQILEHAFSLPKTFEEVKTEIGNDFDIIGPNGRTTHYSAEYKDG